MNYQGLIPVLINSIKEQQNETEIISNRASMTKRILSVLMIFISISMVSQNINDVLPKFNKKGMATDILYNPARKKILGKLIIKSRIYLIIIRHINPSHFLTINRDIINLKN